MKTASHYRSKPNDLDRTLLTVIPDAPRVPFPGLPAIYDWNMFHDERWQSFANVCFDCSKLSPFGTNESLNFQNNFIKKSLSTYDNEKPPVKETSASHGSQENLHLNDILVPAPEFDEFADSPDEYVSFGEAFDEKFLMEFPSDDHQYTKYHLLNVNHQRCHRMRILISPLMQWTRMTSPAARSRTMNTRRITKAK